MEGLSFVCASFACLGGGNDISRSKCDPLSNTKDGRFLIAVGAAVAALNISLLPALGISGGGLDYAGGSFQDADFSGGEYVEKDFSGGSFRNSKFRKADLRLTRFFNSDLKDTDFTDADLSGSTIERAILKNSVLHNTILNGAYLTESVLEAKDISNADFSDALIVPATAIRALCDRPDASGVNPVTQVPTRER